jgi:hypothetical protein
MAMLVVLAIVTLVTVLVAFAITQGGRERAQVATSIHSLRLEDVTESSLQYARGFFAQLPYARWNAYLAVAYPPAQATYPELFPPMPANSGYSCYVYARDDEDEFPPAVPNPQVDNNLRIFVGAVCSQPAAGGGNVTAELSAPLEYNPPLGSN